MRGGAGPNTCGTALGSGSPCGWNPGYCANGFASGNPLANYFCPGARPPHGAPGSRVALPR